MESGLKTLGSGSLEQDGSLSLVAMKREEQTCLVIRPQHQVSQRPLGSAWSGETGETSPWACCSTG
jgi:hypothetical protein